VHRFDEYPANTSGEVVATRTYFVCHMVMSIEGCLHLSRFNVPAAGVQAEVLPLHYEQGTGQFEAKGRRRPQDSC
jgi:hypothetical protein